MDYNMSMKASTRVLIGIVGLAGMVLAVSFAWPAPVSKPAKLAVSATPAPTLPPALDPLQIEAIRSRDYPASVITVTKDLGAQGGYHETVSSYMSDGLTEYALVSTPDGPKPAAGWPVVILAHGYINPAVYQTDGANYAGIISTLARAGYLVIKPDYRGHGQSQGQPMGGHYSPAYAYDILNLISAIKIYPAADPARIGLLGHSMGGHEALRTIVVSKDIKATVFMAGVVGSMNDLMYNWPHSPLLRDQPSALVQNARQGLLAKYGTPAANPAFWDSASAINYVSAISGPVQIHQSVGDSIVPKLFSDHLSQALTNAQKPVEYYVYAGDDHQLAASKTRALIMQRILAFYRAHL
ncbi:MAG: prolyl oligopeptidase family serine peptidase [Candidatus Saccharimonadales bacterium]